MAKTTFMLASVALFTLGCSGSENFKGKTPQTQTSNAAPEPKAYEGDIAAPSVTTPGGASEALRPSDQSALSECLKQWTNPKPPFSPEELAQPKVIDIKEATQNNAIIYSDTTKSTKDTLLLVNFEIPIGNQGTFELLNPKAWYCLNFSAKVVNNFTIHLACNSQLAILSKTAQNDHNFVINRDPCP